MPAFMFILGINVSALSILRDRMLKNMPVGTFSLGAILLYRSLFNRHGLGRV